MRQEENSFIFWTKRKKGNTGDVLRVYNWVNESMLMGQSTSVGRPFLLQRKSSGIIPAAHLTGRY